ncbi:hypothetical protein DPMN_086013 [Dreissena polymorpha]|uniref:DAGKc domain-containing protein n=2 Tax=Dreissena polymorpha TaxID=45954 RepID=A0A9D3YG34_DREPO|nr:hypothetical protein DPMN_086013 [Dreissena polymorpha]
MAMVTEDILSTYDLSSIDGITLVGGDGLFHEAANGIVRRMAVETGSDINNLEFSPMEFTIPMALIPCGTGNGVAKQFLRNYDISTAVYAIVIGFRYKANICSVCSEGRLLSYSVLLVGYGVWGDIIYAAETKRHMGVLRYPASFLSLLFGRFRTLKIKIDIKAPLEFLERNSATMAYLEQPTASGINSKGKETDVDTPGQDSEPEPKKSDVSENRSNFTSYDGYFTGAIVFVEPLSSFVNMFINPTQEAVTNVTQIYMSKPCRKFKFFKSTFQLLDLNSEIVNKPAEPFLELVFKELKIRLLDPQEATSESGRKELILNIDGEITRLEQPEIHIKMFPQRIPLFCNIPAIVVTSRAHHTEEILAIYDLSSIDGIAVVGGDGLYHEAANGLIRRMAADTGGDVNDPNFWPPEFPVAIAIIPCGTGNGIAREQMGNFDIATAVYAAVLGFRSKKNISRVFSNGKLISYSILLVGYGLWGDIIYTSETRRHWGVMRYPASVMSMMLMLSRTRSLNVEIKAPSEFTLRNSANLARIKELTDTQNKSPQGQETDVDNIGSVTNVADSESTKTYQAGFSTIEGRFTGVVMLAEMMSLSCNPSKPHEQDRVTNVSHVFLSKPGGKLQYLKLLYKMYSRDSEIDSNTPACLTVFTADELKLRLMDPHDETSDQGRKERILNIDGDIHLLERTEFHVKLFPERIPMFCNIPVFTGRS